MYSASNPPKTCECGNRLGPNRVLVDFARCFCERAEHSGHHTWTCRVCGRITYADGHVDDTKLMLPPPAFPPSVRIPPAR